MKRVIIVSGIWPPDVGGPATHAARVADALEADGHVVSCHGYSARENTEGRHAIFARSTHPVLRALQVVVSLIRRSSGAVVYATGLHDQVAVAATLKRPSRIVMKVVGDAVWERSRAKGRTELSIEAFQDHRVGLRDRIHRAVWRWSLGRADAIVLPAAYLDRLLGPHYWPHARATVVRNGLPMHPETVRPRTGPARRFLYVGRLIPHKRVEWAISAIARLEEARLEIVGDRPHRGELVALSEQLGVSDRVTFHGPLANSDVLSMMDRCDAFITCAEYEGLPHSVVEALSRGLPVLASDVGGTGDVVSHGHNGLLFDTRERAMEAAHRVYAEAELLGRLSEESAPSVAGWGIDRTLEEVKRVLETGRPRTSGTAFRPSDS